MTPMESTGDPAGAGLCSERLTRLTGRLLGWVDGKSSPGAVAMIFRRQRIGHVSVLGWQDDTAKIPMRRDSIFRIASMSKPITSVATLMLLEEGKLRLGDSIARWLPEFADARVLLDPNGAIGDTYPSPRAVTVRDLLTHRCGIPSGLGLPTLPRVQAASTLYRPGSLRLRDDVGRDDWLRQLGALPLTCPPDTEMTYGFSTDVLGLLVGRVAGQPFEDFLKERIFAPLNMRDTGFFVPAESLARLPLCYAINPIDGQRILIDHPADSAWAKPPSVPSGAGGLVSTVDDYLAFAGMLLGGGCLGSTRLLSRKSVELLTANTMTPEQRQFPFFGTNMWSANGFGLGVSVLLDLGNAGTLGSPGQYGWGGAYGTVWLNDPIEDMILLLMVQLMAADPTPPTRVDFINLAYQAIND